MSQSNPSPAWARRFAVAVGFATTSAMLVLVAAPAAARQDEQQSSSAAPKAPSLAPFVAIGMGVLLAAGLSMGKTPLSAPRDARR